MIQSKILLVDDREDNLISIESILEPDKYVFVKAKSGREALKILLTEIDFALILMDVKMPNLNGFETAELIYEREKLKHIPIIFVTAHNNGDEYVFKGYRAGAVDYIYKPINPAMLRTKVAVFVELYLKNHKLQKQEQKLMVINKSLETEINERKISEEKVKTLNTQLLLNIEQLEIANKDLDRFAFMASHDLKEPLRKIRVFSDRISTKFSETLGDEAKLYLERIQNAAHRMQVLIEDILTFSKISTEKKEFAKSDLNILMDEVINEMNGIVHEKNAQINVEKLPVLSVNSELIKPLFQNLLSNSLKYSRKDITPIIKIWSSVPEQSSEEKYCRIFFEDNGIGFDQKYSEQIFQMFTRLNQVKEVEGTGIGLAFCKKIVEEHRGFISAIGKINEGSLFTVSLPYKNN